MTRRRTFLCGLLAPVLGLSGCLPEERFWWAPQGDRALVAVEGALHLVGVDGALGDALLWDETAQSVVRGVAWLPDGSGFVCQRERVLKSWDAVKVLLDDREVAAVEALAPLVLGLLEAEHERGGDVVKLAAQRRYAAALLLAHQHDAAEVEAALARLAKQELNAVVTGLRGNKAGFRLSELVLVRMPWDGTKLEEPLLLARGMLDMPMLPKVSPAQDMVAFLRLMDEAQPRASLEVVGLDGDASKGLKVTARMSGAFDWMPDGRALVFSTALGGEGGSLQAIHRAGVVMGDEGIRRGTGAEAGVVLATAILLHRPLVKALPDGRVLFASQPAVLPMAGGVKELEPKLFVIAADGSEVRAVPTTTGALPADLGYVVVSPDGRRVAVVESETDGVAVVELETGAVEMVSLPHAGWRCRTLPAWKSAEELTLAALDNADGRPHWWLWKAGTELRRLSGGWPSDMTAGWLEKQDEPKSGEVAR